MYTPRRLLESSSQRAKKFYIARRYLRTWREAGSPHLDDYRRIEWRIQASKAQRVPR